MSPTEFNQLNEESKVKRILKKVFHLSHRDSRRNEVNGIGAYPIFRCKRSHCHGNDYLKKIIPETLVFSKFHIRNIRVSDLVIYMFCRSSCTFLVLS